MKAALLATLSAYAAAQGYPNLDLSSEFSNAGNFTCTDIDCGQVLPDIYELDCGSDQLVDVDFSFMMLQDKLLEQGGELHNFKLTRGTSGLVEAVATSDISAGETLAVIPNGLAISLHST